ncbi:MAG: tRNA lysidine(34) synthetase TilS [Bacillota bacterium]|nr:tRNA lysidine(34) synthetase TilS [Bacillota bacterium]
MDKGTLHVNQGDKIVVGVSGGADSMCLLHLLSSVREKMNLSLIAVHINHGLRGEEAYSDEAFVVKYCEEHDLKVIVNHADVKKYSIDNKCSLEEAGRKIRYDFFAKISKEIGGKIATAHTASDNAETVLFNLTRGSGIKGLCGIPPVRNNIVRPILHWTREEVEAYCLDNQIKYVVDKTNFSEEYTRNQIRLNVVPVLKEINPNFEETITRFTQIVTETDDFLTKHAINVLENAKNKNGGFCCKELKKAETPLLAKAILLLAKQSGIGSLEQKHIDLVTKCICEGSGAVNLPNGFTATAKQGVFRIVKETEKTEFSMPVFEVKSLIFAGKSYLLHTRNFVNKKLLIDAVDYGIINSNSCIRTRKSGDFFTFENRNVTKPVRKIMNEMKIPEENRDKLLLIANGSEVLWLEGVGASKVGCISEKTEKILLIDINEE